MQSQTIDENPILYLRHLLFFANVYRTHPHISHLWLEKGRKINKKDHHPQFAENE